MSSPAVQDLIDVHAHFLTDEYRLRARSAGIDHPDGMPGWPEWDLARQLSEMDRRHIRRAVLSISSPGVHFGDDAAAAALACSVNDAAADIVRARPDRFGFFASLPLPAVDLAVNEARRALGELGAVGVILESNAHGQYLGDAALEPLWAELDAAEAVVFIHPTSPPGWDGTALGRPRPMLEFMFDSTRSVVDLILIGVLARHPSLRIVVPHSGAVLPVLSDRIAMFQRLLSTEPSSPSWHDTMRGLWFDTAGTPFPIGLPVLTEVAGSEHIVYGSDSCWTPAAVVDAQISSIDAAPAPAGSRSWRQLTTRNAERLLSHPRPA